MIKKIAPALGVWLCLCVSAASPLSQRKKDPKLESPKEYYQRWLDQDVAYIISDEEKSVFLRLRTDEERDQFARYQSSFAEEVH